MTKIPLDVLIRAVDALEKVKDNELTIRLLPWYDVMTAHAGLKTYVDAITQQMCVEVEVAA